MTALTDTIDLIHTRHELIVAALDLSAVTAEMLAGEALMALGIDGAAAALTATEMPSVYLSLDVVVWRWVEAHAALGFDFSADGGSYQRSQLFKQATAMRRRAEERAAAAELDAYAWPAIVYEKPVNASLSDEWSDDAAIYQW